MQIQYRTGDVIDGDESVLIHGCNAKGKMGAGVALSIRNRLPFAYDAYRYATPLHLGDVVWAINIKQGERPRIVGNAITQLDYGNEKRRYVDYGAVRLAMHNVNRFVELSHNDTMMIAGIGVIKSVAMPMIGSGLAQGEWSIIEQIIEDESVSFQPIVYQL